jgi:hypothetical protein
VALSRGSGGYSRGSSVVRTETTGPLWVCGWHKTCRGHSSTWAIHWAGPARWVGRFTGQ